MTLYTEQTSGKPARYELSETYLQTRDGDRVFTKAGHWTLLRGSAGDNDAVVFQLDYDQPKTARSFLKVGDHELRLLDRILSFADQDTSPITRFLNVGVGGNGLLAQRSQDEFGIAYAYTDLSDELKDNLDLLPLGRASADGTAGRACSTTCTSSPGCG